ncbi:YHYH protein [bacterium]|nr:YHYH protein [bacterium]
MYKTKKIISLFPLSREIKCASRILGVSIALAAFSQQVSASCEYIVEKNWDSGFVAKIRITNDTPTAVKGWSVDWTFSGGNRVKRLRRANLSGDNPYSASSLRRNSTIKPGETIEFGFTGSNLSGEAAEQVKITGDVCSAAITDGTRDLLCDYSDATENDQDWLTITSVSDWTCSNTTRDLVANGIPDHVVGEHRLVIEAQDVTVSYPLDPVESDVTTGAKTPGYILNGVKLDPGTAGTCNDEGDDCSAVGGTGNWRIEALTNDFFGVDDSNAHVQPGGIYHYHGMPEGFIEKQGGNSKSVTLIGWAADGFPIYARYGYSDPMNKKSKIVNLSGSYQLVTEVPDNRPSVDLYHMGTFTQDWEYVEGLGDLDECNGRFGVTPEFPNGIFHYYTTDDYPFIQRCVSGEVEAAPERPEEPVAPEV